MKTKILVILLAMLATISNACKVGEIQLNGSNACVTDCGKYWEGSKASFRNCTINQLGTPAKDYDDYYLRLPADTPQRQFIQSLNDCLQKGIGCPNPKKATPQGVKTYKINIKPRQANGHGKVGKNNGCDYDHPLCSVFSVQGVEKNGRKKD